MKRTCRVAWIVAVAVVVSIAAGSSPAGTGIGLRNPAEAGSHGWIAVRQAAQAPARDSAKPRAGTARISGRVVTDAGTPVRRAVVRLSSPDSGYSGTTLTDTDGNYGFRDLPDGAYRVSASKEAYIAAFFGSDRRYLQGRTFRVEAGERVRNIDIVVARSCAISGRVYDEFGDPLPNADVTVFRYPAAASHQIFAARSASRPSEARTDDLGQYRVFGLEPGNYYVQAAPNRNAYRNFDEIDLGFLLPTFYPGTPDASQAQAVRVARGQDATGIEFMVAPGRTARVSGTVLDAAGRRTNAGVWAEFQVAPAGSSTPASTAADADGNFVLGPLAPGNYIIGAGKMTAVNGDPDQGDRGGIRLSLAGSDVSGVTIQMTAGSTFSGRVIVDGARRLASFDRVSIETTGVDPTDPLSPNPRPRQVRDDGTFDLLGLFGERVIRVTTPGGWTVKAIYARGRDIMDVPVNFDRGEPITGAQVVLTDRLTRLTVSAADERDKRVDLFYVLVAADDPARWAPALGGRYLRGATSRDGAPVNIDGLPPGDYFVVPFDAEQSLADLVDPDVLGQMRTVGQHFTLREGESKNVTVKVGKQQ